MTVDGFNTDGIVASVAADLLTTLNLMDNESDYTISEKKLLIVYLKIEINKHLNELRRVAPDLFKFPAPSILESRVRRDMFTKYPPVVLDELMQDVFEPLFEQEEFLMVWVSFTSRQTGDLEYLTGKALQAYIKKRAEFGEMGVKSFWLMVGHAFREHEIGHRILLEDTLNDYLKL